MKPAELRNIRESLGLTQEQLATELGVHRLSVIRWEAGRHRIRPMLILAIGAIDQRRRKEQEENSDK
jgi:DNA-binding XRE family transcriptional regulator